MRAPRLVQPDPGVDAAEQALHEISAAIQLVATGHATRVVIAGLPDPAAVAGAALALAQAGDVRFALERDGASASVSVVVGPVER